MNKKYIAFMIVVMIAISAVATKANAFTLGQRGQDVADLQVKLIEAGFDIPAITSGVAIPGYFGTQTQKALAAYEGNGTSGLRLGAVPTLDAIDNPFVSINGVKTWQSTVAMAATSTILCSIPNGLSATSTIVSASAEVTSRGGINAANNFSISTSSTFYASTTPALVYHYAMGTGQFSVELLKNTATSTASLFGVPANVLPGMQSSGNSNYYVGPTDRVQFTISTTTGTAGVFGTYMTGKCSLQLKKI